ncbi:MAG: lipoprotein-releasing ABC transporter permease subunit [Gammaproteobacteria bacterium]|nr:lipoprotein-releasing ABC transporter permease subunit [Gammaproteobacteria bacterium]
MFKPFEIFIGLRYTRAKRRNHFISFISVSSMLGIAVGVTALITVLSVMNGFEEELRERILGVASHVTVRGPAAEPLKEWSQLAEQIATHNEVEGMAPYIRREGMLSNGSLVSGTIIRGILPDRERTVSEVGEKMTLGHLDNLRPGSFGIILGADLAAALRVSVGDKVTLITPQANITPVGVMPRLKRFTVVGIFRIGMYEYDSALALLHIEDAAKLFRMNNTVTGLRLKMDNLFGAPALAQALRNELPQRYYISDWSKRHANFFRAIKTEKTVMFVILFLIVAVAVFNIVSTLVMVVTDKQSDIAILRTLGATPGSILSIFMVQGTLIGLVGTLLGVLGGVSLALNVETIVPAIEQMLGVQFLAADVYYISDLPSKMVWADVITIAIASFILSILATIYPAARAARIQPAEALRYE